MKKKLLILIAIVFIASAGYKGYQYYTRIFKDNITLEDSSAYFFVPTGSSYEDVMQLLKDEQLLKNYTSFRWLAEIKNYPNNIHPGRYKIKPTMGNNEFVNLLRSGKQAPVDVTFNNIRTREELAGEVARQIEADSASLAHKLNSSKVAEKYGFSKELFKCMFIPNTYEFYWDSSAKDFIERMHREYEKFWTDARQQKAREANLTKEEVITLASIVEEEQDRHDDEKPIIAGLYINRLEKGMRLQACPTLIYAIGDVSRRRVLNKHLDYESPYNTYKNAGLPPAPINFPEISSINAVLNYKEHDYLYMAAKADFSGYHHFSDNYNEHLRHANKYQRVLNEKKIYK